ncbi:MAG: hypothetical protein JL50_04690 [Peptococcaceae bacterium BICA1-7]|nr:MAG: hypothetical protein JL50_04690 [Peptococcaceae bacterium BICA1-7]HBV95920.1 sigma-54-dependent Fis family transcriptional regulator [Desulfotomaculum sp.]
MGNRKIFDRWEEYHSNPISRQGLRPEIADSWERSQQYGVSPATPKPVLCTNSELSQYRRNSRLLIYSSVPVLENTLEFLAGSDFIMGLFDTNAVVLKTFGDESSLHWAAGVGLVEGAKWSEDVMGTNAATLGLKLARPISLEGCENFSRIQVEMNCSFAPIIDQAIQKLVGGLILAGPADISNNLSLGMVTSATKHIESKIAFDRYNETITNSVSEGILIVDLQGKIIYINKSGFRIFRKECKPFCGLTLFDLIEYTQENHHFLEVLTQARSMSDETLVLVVGKEKVSLNVNITYYDIPEMNLVGNVIVIQESERINRLIRKYIARNAKMSFSDIIGSNPRFLQVIKIAKAAASSDSNVLLLGESGTGKDIIAQSMHNASSRMNNPFLAINCAALPRELIASELFGYEDGAFTGAKKGGNLGKFELADQGTLFLDEIGDMPLDLQASLLRVIEEKSVMRLGGGKLIPVNVRIIAATNKSLEDEVVRNRFRRDLYYRLGVIRINLPPLRERSDDIIILARQFISRICQRIGKPEMSLSPEVSEAFLRYGWPGNIRELQNALEGAIQLSSGQIITYDLIQEYFSPVDEGVDSLKSATIGDITMSDIKKQAIESTLQKNNYNKSKTAKSLGISRKTLYRRLKEYSLI